MSAGRIQWIFPTLFPVSCFLLLISHRLANVVQADNIYVLENGRVAESGSHDDLLKKHGLYERLWNAQQSLENYGKEGDAQ